MTDVRSALRSELEARGLDVADDTVASRGQIYVKGDGDLAAGLFDFKSSAREAVDTMYQGHWSAGLPPRFAVLPAAATAEPDFEMLEQVRIGAVLYEVVGDVITFRDLDASLTALIGNL